MEPTDNRGRCRRLLLVTAVAGGCLAVTLAAFFHARAMEYRVARAAFEGRAARHVVLIRQQLSRCAESIESLADVVRLNPRLSDESFHRHASLAMRRHPEFYSLAWSQWISADQRQAVVEAVRQDGYAIDDVLAMDEQDRPVSAPPRGHHLVVRHFYPSHLAPQVAGLDVLSRPNRLEAVQQAMDSGETAATAPVRLGADPSDLPSLLVFVPVYDTPLPPPDVQQRRESFRGTLSVGFVLQSALEHWLASDWERLLQTVVYHVGPDGRVLFAHGMGEGAEVDLESLRRHRLARETTVDFAGTQWQVLSVPGPVFMVQWRREPLPWLVLGLGAMLSLLATVLAALAQRHDAAMRRFAQERAVAAEQLARTNASLRQANEDMEQFVSAVSHDLKNPLVGIEWTCQAVQTAMNDGRPEDIRQDVAMLRRSCRRMRRLVDDLLAHSRAGFAPLATRDVDVDALVRKLVADHAAQAAQAGAIVQTAGSLPTVRGDAGRLAAAFDNLIANALKYARRPNATQPRVVIGCEPDGMESADRRGDGIGRPTAWRFYVRDNGPGIAMEDRKRIFDVFVRLAEDDDGTGIGLAIVRRVAEAHGGRAWVEDSPGGGATFWFTIPDNAPQRAQRAQRAQRV
jgi:signal transduction histidine kinase